MTPVQEAIAGWEHPKNRASIVCLCGSTRFLDQMQTINAEFTLAGWIVLAPVLNKSSWNEDPQVSLSQASELDRLHLEKIKISDLIYVVNIDGYIGNSTRHEINYAAEINKVVKYHVPVLAPAALPDWGEPPPVPNDRRYIQLHVIDDINSRLDHGVKKYGTGLQPHNGRNAIKDLYEELLDAVMYAKQILIEQSGG